MKKEFITKWESGTLLIMAWLSRPYWNKEAIKAANVAKGVKTLTSKNRQQGKKWKNF